MSFFAEQVGKARAEVPAPGAAQILHSHMDGSKGDVFEHVHVVEQVELLEHHAHAAALDVDVDFQVAEVVPFKKDVAVRRVFQNVETAQESAFAAARRPDDGDLFARGDLFGNIVEHDEVAVTFGQMLHLDERGGVGRLHGGALRFGKFGFCRLFFRPYGRLRGRCGHRCGSFSVFHSCASSFPQSG